MYFCLFICLKVYVIVSAITGIEKPKPRATTEGDYVRSGREADAETEL